METNISVEDVYYRYPNSSDWALEDINLTFQPGEKVAILGSNGSGKSTLARLLNGLLIPTQGKVTVGSWQTQDPQQLMQIRSRVGFLFQNPENQIVGTTVEEEIAFGPRNQGLDPVEVERRVHLTMKMVGLTAYHQVLTNQLSGGELQRLALAGVLVMEPKYLLLDEAFSMLDEPAKGQLLGVLQGYSAQKSLGWINITHDLSDLVWCQRAIVLNNGKVAYNGLARTLLEEENRLEAFGLVLPPLHKLLTAVRAQGVQIPASIDTKERLVDWIATTVDI